MWVLFSPKEDNILPGLSWVMKIPIVSEFVDVFPKDLSRLPPDRDVEFTIELVLSTAPISKAPYQMAPIVLKELEV